MLKLSHATLIALSGLMWLAIGCFLLPLGLKLLLESAQTSSPSVHYPLLDAISPFVGGANEAAVIVIAFCLFLGYIKGKIALGKSVLRSVARIQSFPNPTSLKNIYGPTYYILLAVMMLLGFSIKYFGVVSDIRGAVDVAVGSALIQGATIYFHIAWALYQKKPLAE